MNIENISYVNFEDMKPLIATPCYGGLIHEGYLRGFSSLIVQSIDIGMSINLATVINESLITRARNELVKYFMQSDSTHLIFIDADIQFKPDDVFRLLAHDQDVVVGAYPLKAVRWDRLDDESIRNYQTVEQLRNTTTSYVVNCKFASDDDLKRGTPIVENSLIELEVGGTGFMCIKRGVIEAMIESMPEILYRKEENFLNGINDDGIRWAIFDTEIEKTSGYFLSEDYTFCRRWQRLGGKVWLDPTITLTHWGTYAFQGREFFKFTEK